MADVQVKTANICNITPSTELRGNGGGTGTFLANNSIEVYCNGSAYWSGVFFTSGSESLIVGDKYTISFTPYCTNNNTIRVQFCGVADNYTFTSGIRKTITVTAVDTIRTVAFYAGDAVEKTIIIKDIQIEKGETATVYRPYSATGWVHSLRKMSTATEAVENPLYSDGTAITAYTLKGNEEHTGTPSPSNPVMPNGVGNKTANLCDVGSYSSAILNNCTIAVSNDVLTQTNTGTLSWSAWKIDDLQVGTDYTMSVTINNPDKTECQIRIYNSTNSANINSSSSSKATSITLSVNFTAQTTTHYIRLYSNTSSATANTYSVEFSEIMLNAGSTALPYEPYGMYKIPISSGGVTTPMYLSQQLFKIGDTTDSVSSSGTATYETTETIFDGSSSEAWSQDGTSGTNSRYRIALDSAYNNTTDVITTHYVTEVGWGENRARLYKSGTTVFLYISVPTSTYPTVSDFKAFLADQYTAGTPLKAYYVKATPTTETVTAPSIFIIEGANTITVDTTVQPSEFTATWTGWHDSSVKEYDGTDWQ